MARLTYVTSESVTEGHPDKICDRISDAVLDTLLEQDPDSRVAVECLVTTGTVIVSGEVSTEGYADVQRIARQTLKEIGYTNPEFGIDNEDAGVLVSIHEQSPDIARGVDEQGDKDQGAGDQGMMYGFACDETPELMPLPIMLAHRLTRKLAEVRRSGEIEGIGPDGKSQVTVEYHDGKPERVAAVVISTQHLESKTTEDLLVAARNNHIVSLNNISHLSPARQDALCSISTGGGVGGRKFYTNSEESLFEIKRAVMINGIKTLATAPDLVDRTVRVELPKLVAYRKESEMWSEFEKDHAIIFGGFLDLFSKTLAILPSIEIARPPRMADFAYLGEALFMALKIDSGFIRVYDAKRQLAADKALEGSPVAQAVQEFIKSSPGWSGTVGALYEQLSILHNTPSAWPKSPRGLGDQLRVIAPAMEMLGFKIEFDPKRHNDGYHVLLGYIHAPADGSTPSQRSQYSPDNEDSMTYSALSERSEHGEHIELPAGANEGCAQCGGEGCQWCSSSISHRAEGATQ